MIVTTSTKPNCNATLFLWKLASTITYCNWTWCWWYTLLTRFTCKCTNCNCTKTLSISSCMITKCYTICSRCCHCICTNNCICNFSIITNKHITWNPNKYIIKMMDNIVCITCIWWITQTISPKIIWWGSSWTINCHPTSYSTFSWPYK